LRLIEKENFDEKKIYSFLSAYKHKPYSEYIKDNFILTELFYKKILNLFHSSDCWVVEDDSKYLALVNLRKSEWDSSYFDLEIGKIDHFISLSDKASKFLINSLQPLSDYHVVMTKIPTSDQSIVTLQNEGFHVMDTNVTYSFDFIKQHKPEINNPNILVRSLRKEDIVEICDFTQEAFSKFRIGSDHFHADTSLPIEKTEELYGIWAENIMKEKEGPVFVAELNNSIAGFCGPFLINEEAKEKKCSIGSITLSAVNPKFHGKGVYTAMGAHSQKWFQDKVDYEEISSHIDNIAVQHSWTKNGFKIVRSLYSLHYHGKRKIL